MKNTPSAAVLPHAAPSLLLLAAALAAPHPARAESGAFYGGLPQAVAGHYCADPGSVSIHVQGRTLSLTEAHGPAFKGMLRQNSSFHLSPVPQDLVEKRLLAPPVLDGQVSPGMVSGAITSRWCTYRFAAARQNSP